MKHQNGLADDVERLPQPSVSGNVSAALASSEIGPLRRAIEETCGELQREFPMLGQRSIAKAAVKYVRSILVPTGPRGAPRKEQLDLAEKLRAANAPWRRVYIEVGTHSSEARNTLRNSLRQRKRRAAQKAQTQRERDKRLRVT